MVLLIRFLRRAVTGDAVGISQQILGVNVDSALLASSKRCMSVGL